MAPVINPLGRYRNAQELLAGADPPDWAGHIPDRHETYWGTGEAMAEGSPTMILERGEKVAMPPAIYIQGRPDELHLYHDPDAPDVPGLDAEEYEPERFVRNYRQAGGEIDLVYIETPLRQSPLLYAPLTRFFCSHL